MIEGVEVVGYGVLFCLSLFFSSLAFTRQSYVCTVYCFLSTISWFALAMVNLVFSEGTVFIYTSYLYFALGAFFIIVGIWIAIKSFGARKAKAEMEI